MYNNRKCIFNGRTNHTTYKVTNANPPSKSCFLISGLASWTNWP